MKMQGGLAKCRTCSQVERAGNGGGILRKAGQNMPSPGDCYPASQSKLSKYAQALQNPVKSRVEVEQPISKAVQGDPYSHFAVAFCFCICALDAHSREDGEIGRRTRFRS